MLRICLRTTAIFASLCLWNSSVRSQDATEPLEALIHTATKGDFSSGSVAYDKLVKMGPAARKAIPSLLPVIKAKASGFEYAGAVLVHIGADAVPATLELLSDRDDSVRAEGYGILGAMGPVAHAAVPSLIAKLTDPSEADRLQAMKTLARIGPKAEPALPLIASCLEDESNGVHAIEVLIKFGPQAVPHVAKVLEQSKSADARRWAAVTLGHIAPEGKPLSVPALAKALSDADASVRAYSAKSLSKFEREAKPTLPRLTKLLSDENDQVRTFAALAIGNMGDHANSSQAALIKAVDTTGLTVVWAISQIGPDEKAIPALVKVIQTCPSHWTATHAVRALVRIGPAANSAIEREVVPALVKELSRNDDLVWEDVVLKSLIELGPRAKDAVPHVRKLLTSSDLKAKLLAVGLAGEIGPAARDCIPDLLRILKQKSPDTEREDSDTIASIRSEAAWALGKIGKDAQVAVPLLRAELIRDSYPIFRRRAMDAIANIESRP